jgi:hypothetical protein
MLEFPTEEEPLDVTEIRQVKRITIAQVFQSMFDAFNVDRGGIFTAKQLFIDPGNAVRDYLGANRYHYTPPFRLLIITTAVALFAISIADFTEAMTAGFTKDISDSVNETKTEKVDITKEVTQLLYELSSYHNILLWTLLPFLTFFSWLMNLKKPFNFAEHFVFQTYLSCVSNILSFLFPLDHILPLWLTFVIVYMGVFFYYVYGYKEFLKKSWMASFLEVLFVLFFGSIIWSTVLGVFFGIYIVVAVDF